MLFLVPFFSLLLRYPSTRTTSSAEFEWQAHVKFLRAFVSDAQKAPALFAGRGREAGAAAAAARRFMNTASDVLLGRLRRAPNSLILRALPIHLVVQGKLGNNNGD